ncbi:hypothetical protein BH09VER1_BH09VER1_28010 [soil metagenome]
MNIAPLIDMLPENALESVQRKIQEIPDVSAGWKVFDHKMHTWHAQRQETAALWRQMDERARQYGGNKLYTRGNFLRTASNRASELSFHYAIVGHEASFEMASEITELVCAEAAWMAQASRNHWKSDLWTADYSAAMGLSIGLIGDRAGAMKATSWRDALLKKGVHPLLSDWIDPESRIHALDSMGHNWWSVCASGAALGLFAVRSDWKEADEWLDRIADGFVEFFTYPGNVLQNKQRTFGADGDYLEPVGYLDYALHNLFLVLDLFQGVLGRDLASELPGLEKIPDYYLATIQPLGERFQRLNFGNMGSGSHSIDGASHGPVPSWLWLAARYGRGDLLHLIRRMRRLPQTAYEFLYWPEDVAEADFSNLKNTTVFQNIGTAVLRDGYEPDATVFAIKTGENWNHNHSDAGSFILSSAGREFIVDPGTTEYTNSLNGSYFWRSDAHNVILHGGRGQSEELHDIGTKFMGRIAGQLESSGYRYILADATGPWEGVYQRFYRHVFWLDRYIILVDDLMAASIAPWTQLLHHRGVAVTKGDRTEIVNGGETLVVHHVWPREFTREVRQGHISRPVPNPWKQEYSIEEEPYLAFTYPARERREKFIQVFELPGSSNSQIQLIEGEHISGVRITTSEKSWEIICNHLADGRAMHQNAWIKYGRWNTDAFLLVAEWSPDRELLSVGLHNGSQVKLDSQLLYSALLKGDLYLKYEGDGVKITSALTSSAFADVSLSTRAGATRTRLRLASGEREYYVRE